MRVNVRTLIIGIVVAAGALWALGVLRPGGSWDATTSPRRDPLEPNAARLADVPLPRVRLSPDERPQAEPSPRRRAPAGSSTAELVSPSVPTDPSKPKNQTKDKSLERLALAHVGADSLAEAIWLDAINDPFLSAQERSDLIEDLNEEGFADPRNLTPNDIPLIASRLALIEHEAPFAMDETNAAAFAEAYKDLASMYERASATAAAANAAAAAAAEAAAVEAAPAEAQASQGQPPNEATSDTSAPRRRANRR